MGGEPHQPARLIEIGEASLRTVGLSSAKARYVLNLAEAVASGQVPLDEFDDSWDDQAITESLTAVKGIGVWTAEMFLIFALNRPDILPDERPGRAGRPARSSRAGRAAQATRLPRPGRKLAALPHRSPVGTSGKEPTHRSPAPSAPLPRPVTRRKSTNAAGDLHDIRPDLEGRLGDRRLGRARLSRRRGFDRYDDRRGRPARRGRGRARRRRRRGATSFPASSTLMFTATSCFWPIRFICRPYVRA